MPICDVWFDRVTDPKKALQEKLSDYIFNTSETLQLPLFSAELYVCTFFRIKLLSLILWGHKQPEKFPSLDIEGFTGHICEQNTQHVFCLQEMNKAIYKDV